MEKYLEKSINKKTGFSNELLNVVGIHEIRSFEILI